jgi:hypothetical protein
MIVGKVKTADGHDADIVVGGGDGGEILVNNLHQGDGKNTVTNTGPYGPNSGAPPPSYGNAPGSGVGESIEGQRVGGGYPPEKSSAPPQWR